MVFSDRKYLGSGFSSKMSDNEDALPVLGNPEILAVKHLPLHSIPQFCHLNEHPGEVPSFIARQQAFNVLNKYDFRSFDFDNIEESSPEWHSTGVGEAFSLSCN